MSAAAERDLPKAFRGTVSASTTARVSISPARANVSVSPRVAMSFDLLPEKPHPAMMSAVVASRRSLNVEDCAKSFGFLSNGDCSNNAHIARVSKYNMMTDQCQTIRPEMRMRMTGKDHEG